MCGFCCNDHYSGFGAPTTTSYGVSHGLAKSGAPTEISDIPVGFMAPTGAAQAVQSQESQLTNPYLDGLVGGTQYDMSSGPVTFYLQDIDFDNNGINDWNEDGMGAAMRAAFLDFERVADIQTQEVFSVSEANLIETIGAAETANGNALGWHFTPNPSTSTANGEYWHDQTGFDSNGAAPGGVIYVLFLHELGHAFGLEHPHDDDLFPGVSDDGDTGDNNLNQGVFSVMSYIDGYNSKYGTPNSYFGHAKTLMALDIAALHFMYGANDTYAVGDDVYNLVDENVNGTGWESIWDAGGTDTIQYTGLEDANIFLGEATIDNSATGGGFVSAIEGIQGGFTIAQNAKIENAAGGGGNDLLSGNDLNNLIQANAGEDSLHGGSGDDTLEAGDGNDILFGDTGTLAALDGTETVQVSGIQQGAGTLTKSSSDSYDDFATALDVTGEFSLTFNSDINNSTTIPHVTVNAVGSGDRDYYQVDIASDGVTVSVDIDNGVGGATDVDTVVSVYDASGTLVAQNDDGSAPGEGSSFDSYLSTTLESAGTYYIQVGSYSQTGLPGPVASGRTYDLHISVDDAFGVVRDIEVPIALPVGIYRDYFDLTDSGIGDDLLDAGAGDDVAYGGGGADVLIGAAGSDMLFGGDAGDVLIGDENIDVVALLSSLGL